MMGLIRKYFNNARKPEGLLGKIMVSSMNRAHAEVSDWGMSHLKRISPADIAELGCGGGRNTVELLKRYPEAKVTALDHSEIAVRKTGRLNKDAISAGRCRVIQGDVSALPFETESFDLITAFETVYFWQGLEESFREVFRVLRPGGLFLIVNETDGTDKKDEKWKNTIDGLEIYDRAQLICALEKAGFIGASADRDAMNHRLCVLAKKQG